MTISDVKIGL